MLNIPKVKMGVVAVSRDCFPIALSESLPPRGGRSAPTKGRRDLRMPGDRRGRHRFKCDRRAERHKPAAGP